MSKKRRVIVSLDDYSYYQLLATCSETVHSKSFVVEVCLKKLLPEHEFRKYLSCLFEKRVSK